MEYLDYLTDVEWNQLPTDYKNSKIEHTNTVRSIKRLEKQLINIDLKRKDIIKQIRLLKRDKTKLYNKLQFVNRNYNPKCYINSFYKNDIEYLNLIIKYSNISKPIYLGKPKNVLDKMKPIVPNLTLKNIKTKLTLYFTDKVKSHLDYSNPKLLLKNKLSFSDLI